MDTDTLRTAARSGAVAGIATTLATSACGVLEQGNAVAPLNSVSHIVWGDEAASHDDVSWKYTATGTALNAAAVMSWAVVHELVSDQLPSMKSPWKRLASGALVSALAFVTDYYVVPKRLTPGFEKRLSNRSLLGIYSVLALSLALGGQQRGR